MVVLAGGILIYNNEEDKRVKAENQKVKEILEKEINKNNNKKHLVR